MRTAIAITAAVSLLYLSAEVSAQPLERVLIPSVANDPIPGAHGSLWVTEISGQNLGAQTLSFFFPIGPNNQCVYKEVSPQATFTGGFDNSVHGAIARFAPDQAAQLTLSVRVRDLSRSLLTWGTELPVVRESEVGTSDITLLNIPYGERFRTTLRMYDFGEAANEFIVTVFALDGAQPLAQLRLPPRELRDAGGSRQDIRYAVLTSIDLQTPAPARLRITVTTAQKTRFWAFASITNNDTQHVTVIRPDRAQESGTSE